MSNRWFPRLAKRSEVRQMSIQEMVEAREIKRIEGDFFEDLGGHIWHESTLDPLIEEFEKTKNEEKNEQSRTS